MTISQLKTGALALFLLGGMVLSCAESAEKLISDFSNKDDLRGIDWGREGVDVSIGPRLVTERSSVLRLTVKSGQYPGVSFYAPLLPKDWSAYEALSFVVWSPAERDLAIRIDDQKSVSYNTRYNGGAHLLAGRNRIQSPTSVIAKTLNLKEIKGLVLFLDSPPANFSLAIDDLKLSALEPDITPFIPYAERMDRQPRMDIVSPHLPMGRQLSGGPLSAFMITGVTQGREVVEMMQRLDYDPKVLTWDREWGPNTWGFGDFYGQRGSGLDTALMQRYLASSMQGPEKFEVLLMTTPMGWKHFGLSARQAILERVRDRGEGLVLVMPFSGDRGTEWPADLRELSALIDADGDWVDDGGGVRQPAQGREFGRPWVVQGTHPITQDIPLAALPQSDMQTQRYRLAPGAQALITLNKDNVPVMAVRQVGKGRVVTFATRGWSLTPLMMAPDDFVNRPDHRYQETWYALLNRAALWAAGRPLERSGSGQVLKVEGIHADPWYTVRQWYDAQGKVTDWALDFANPHPDRQRITITAPATRDPGADITLQFTAPAGMDEVTWRATFGELGHG
jgi:hypothetical protein